jgi:hypothetical protein
MTASTTRARYSLSVRPASSAIELYVLHVFLGIFHGRHGALDDFLPVELNLYLMCESLVPMPVWMRLCLANFSESAATSMSFSTARVKAQMVGHVTAFDISIHGVEVARAGNGEACFDDVHAQ